MERPAFDFPGLVSAGGISGTTPDRRPRRRSQLQTAQQPFRLRADNLDEWENYFKENGQEYVPRRTRPDGAFQIYVADPDGYHIELFTGP